MSFREKVQTKLSLERDSLQRHAVENYGNGLNSSQIERLSTLARAGYSDAELGQFVVDMLSQSEQRSYDESEASRLRSDGINPDLSGLSGASGESLQSPAHAPLPSAGGNGSLAARFHEMSSTLLGYASFGLNLYGTVANAGAEKLLAMTGEASGFAKSMFGDEDGIVSREEVGKYVRDRGYTGKKAKQFTSIASQLLNSPEMQNYRLGMQRDNANLVRERHEAVIKSSPQFLANQTRIIELTQQQQMANAAADSLLAMQKKQFLLDNPDYTEQKLNDELALSAANVTKAQNDARKSGIDADNALKQGQLIEENIEFARLRNEEQRSNNEVTKASNKVELLRQTLLKIELECMEDNVKFYLRIKNDPSLSNDAFSRLYWTGEQRRKYDAGKAAYERLINERITPHKASLSIAGLGSASIQ